MESRKTFLYAYEAVSYLLRMNICNFDLQYCLTDVEYGVYLSEVNGQSPYIALFGEPQYSKTADMEWVYTRYKEQADTFTLVKHYGELGEALFLNREYLPLKAELIGICRDTGFGPSDEAWQYRFRLNALTWSWLLERRSAFAFLVLEDLALWQGEQCLYATVTHEKTVSD